MTRTPADQFHGNYDDKYMQKHLDSFEMEIYRKMQLLAFILKIELQFLL
jgi:hypothetical protein